MKKLSFAMFVIVGLFMLFSGIHSVYGGGKQQAKEAVIVKQVKVGGGPFVYQKTHRLYSMIVRWI